MRIGIVTVGDSESAGRTAVLDVSPRAAHEEVVRQAAELLGLLGEPFVEYRCELRRLEDPTQGFPLPERIGALAAKVNPFHDKAQPGELDVAIELGRYFGFCRASDAADEAFLKWLGFPKPPSLVSRFGSPREGPDEHIDPFAITGLEFRSAAAVASDRLVYEPGQPVAVFALAMRPRAAADGEAHLRLLSGGTEVPGSARTVALRGGLGVAQFDDLPEGHYTAALDWDDREAECRFTVGRFSRSAAAALWLDGPRIDAEAWVGTVRLSLYGVPLAAGVQVECGLAAEGPPRPATVALTTEEGGLLHLRLPNTHPDCRVVGFHWRDGVEHAAQLPLPGAEQFDGELGVRAMTAPHEGSTRAAGLHVSLRLDETCPLRLKSAAAHRITLTATRDLDAAAVTGLFPDEEPVTHTTGKLRAGQEIALDLPSRCGYGFLCVGAIAGEECFEAAAPVFAPTELEVTCEVPALVHAGEKATLTIQANDLRPTPVAVIVRDARMHSGGGLEAAAAAARLEALGKDWDQGSPQRGIGRPFAGPPPGRFSDCYLDATFALHCEARQELLGLLGTTTGWEGGMAYACAAPMAEFAETLEDTGAVYAEMEPVPPVRPSAAAAPSGVLPLKAVRPVQQEVAAEPVRERVDVLLADVVTVERGRLELEIDVPARPAAYTVDLLAVDTQHLGWTTHQATFRARRPVEVHADTLPACVHPLDAGQVAATVAVVTMGEHVELSASRDGEPVPLALADGTPVAGGVGCEPGSATQFELRLCPGAYQFLASSEGGAHAAEAMVHPADRISERVRRLVLLEAGQGFDLGACGHVFDLRLVGDPEEVFRRCGQAVADYSHACCEQTAAKMLGAWLALAAGDADTRFKAIGTLRQGVERLEGMWRRGGFAMYPDQGEPHDYWGRAAYRHLVGMRPLRRLLGDAPGLNGDVSTLAQRIESITTRAAGAYGPALTNGIGSCHDAWLAFAERPAEALAFIQGRWERVEGPKGLRGQAPGEAGSVSLRAETCYAAAVLASDEPERRARHAELVGTLNWLGDQMKGAGRLYSTVDSGALLAFLAAARAYGLMAAGKVQLDGGEPLTTVEANRLVQHERPRLIFCTEGQAQLFVDGVFEQKIPAEAAGASISVGLELGGRRCTAVRLGDELDLRIDAGRYQAGLVAHVLLPPCLAFEEGGVRLQTFQRDFAGRDHLRIPCRAIAPTGERPQHGMVLIRNMFVEEQLAPATIDVRVAIA